MSIQRSKKIFGWSAVLCCLMLSLVEFLIICKVVPYDIIMGGRLESYEQAVGGAIFSILVQLFIIFMTLVVADIVKIERLQKMSNLVLRIFRAYLVINIGLNLLGKTWFEKVVASLLALLEIICITQIIKKES